jgi:NADH-quinone oxidoreductase subunit M
VVIGALPLLPVHAAIAAAAVVVTCGYLLSMLRRVVFGPLNPLRNRLPDMTGTEALSIMPLCVATLIVGVFPHVLVSVMANTLEAVVRAIGG